MRYIAKTIILSLLMLQGATYAQDGFIRPSISVIEVVFSDESSSIEQGYVDIPEQFDSNNISTNVIKLNSKDKLYTLESGLYDYNKIFFLAYKNKNIGSQALLNILPIKESQFSNEVLKEKGLYTASDAQINAVKGTINKGFANVADNFGDLGIKQLNQIYVMLINVSDYNVHYDKSSTIVDGNISFSVIKVRNGLDAVYKFSDNPEDIKTANWGGEVVYHEALNGITATGDNYNEAKGDFSEGIITRCFFKTLRKIEAFQPKTTILNRKRATITAKLGTKENVKIDNRFFVFEKVQKVDKNTGGNNIILKKRGIVRAKKVSDNTGVSTGETAPSKFYKVAGGRMEEGMLMIQKEDIGVGISLGYGNMNSVRLDYRVKGIYPGFKMFFSFINLGITQKFSLNEEKLKKSLSFFTTADGKFLPLNWIGFNIEAGFEWAYIINSRFELLPFAALGFSSLEPQGKFFESLNGGNTYSWDNNTEKLFYSSIFGNFGGRLKFNLSGSLSILGSAGTAFTILQNYEDISYERNGFKGSFNKQGEDKSTFYKNLISSNPSKFSDFVWDIALRYEF